MWYAPSVPPTTPSCPRCGYDQSGVISSWGESEPPACPLDGVCSECGLEFAWRDLLNPTVALELRFFEHARAKKAWSLLLTVWRALHPASFWRWVRMEHEIVPRRLAVATLAGMCLMHAGVTLAATALVVAWHGFVLVGSEDYRGVFGDWGAAAIAHTLWPLGDLRDIAADLIGGGTAWTVSNPRITIVQFGEREPLIRTWLSVALLTTLLTPFSFLCLPDTLNRARVRRGHLARIAAYQLVTVPAVIGTPMLVWLASSLVAAVIECLEFGRKDDFAATGFWSFEEGHGRLAAALILLSCGYWWWTASRYYLRLQATKVVVPVMYFVSLLAALTVAALIPSLRTGLLWW